MARTNWTNKSIKEAALMFDNKADFRANNYPAYKAAHRRRILDDVCSHMQSTRIEWTDEMLAKEAQKYSSRMDFYTYSKAYQIAAKRGILGEICIHMDSKITRWTEDMILEEASKFDTRSEFKSGNPLAYARAQRLNLLDTACAHMDYKYKYWTDQELAAEAKKYGTRHDFQKNSSAYGIAHKRGILDQICAHMPYTERVNWTPDLLVSEALKYSTRGDFYRKNNNAYSYARRLGILDEITKHLEYQDNYNTRDVVYLWHAENDIFKVGITSENLGDQRIYDVAKDAGYTPEIIALESVGTVRAKQIEAEVLKLGERVLFKSSFSGSTEFRHLSSLELNRAIELILSD